MNKGFSMCLKTFSLYLKSSPYNTKSSSTYYKNVHDILRKFSTYITKIFNLQIKNVQYILQKCSPYTKKLFHFLFEKCSPYTKQCSVCILNMFTIS